jgi:hypothetical protein
MILLGKGAPPCHHAMRTPYLGRINAWLDLNLDTRFIGSTG